MNPSSWSPDSHGTSAMPGNTRCTYRYEPSSYETSDTEYEFIWENGDDSTLTAKVWLWDNLAQEWSDEGELKSGGSQSAKIESYKSDAILALSVENSGSTATSFFFTV